MQLTTQIIPVGSAFVGVIYDFNNVEIFRTTPHADQLKIAQEIANYASNKSTSPQQFVVQGNATPAVHLSTVRCCGN
jgi:hypothetical protein